MQGTRTNTYFQINHLSQATKKPTNLHGDDVSHPSTSRMNSNVSPSFNDDEKDLKCLQDYHVIPALPSGDLIIKPNKPNRNAIKTKPAIDHYQHRPISPKPEENEKPKLKDLIDFSDTDCMSVGTLSN